MKKIICFLTILALMYLSGCSSSKSVTGDIAIAKEYVKAQGYNVSLITNQIQKYTLTKDKLIASPYDNIWGVQEGSPSEYIGKDIIVYNFIVTNHPLDKLENNPNKRTKLYVMMSDNKVIGGYSVPDNDSVGSLYSLNGKTLEEITGTSLEKWRENWNNKYNH